MKTILLVAALLAASSALAQTMPAATETGEPAKGVTTILVHTPDSADVAYGKAVQGLLAQGYGIDKRDQGALFMSTASRPLEKGVSLKIQLVTTADATGSSTTFRGVFTWLSTATLMARVEGREMPVTYTGPGDNPTKRAWSALEQAATAALPAGSASFK